MKRWIVMAVVASFSVSAAFAATNLVDLHKNAKANAAQCAGCHACIKKQKSSDPKVKAFHPLHLESPLLKFTCVDCHQSVDLSQESGAKLRKQVDPGICKSCHAPWSSKMNVSFQKMDCTTCHSKWQQKMAKATTVNLKAVTSKNCFGCHGGRALYVNSNPEKGG